MKEEQRIVVCPSCHGEGYELIGVEDQQKLGTEFTRRSCAMCSGQRVVREVTRTHYETVRKLTDQEAICKWLGAEK